MFSEMDKYRASAGGMLGAGLGSLISGWDNPSDSAMNYMNQIQPTLEKYLSPYSNAGMESLPFLKSQYSNLINNPGQRLNEIGKSYQQSPGFDFALNRALQGSNHAAAAGGMAGSPQAQEHSMQIATQYANQDYNNFLRNALGMYGMGLQGHQGLYDTGAKTGMAMGEDLSSVLANQAKLAYEGQNAQNQRDEGIWGSILGGAGQLAGLAGMFSSSELKDYVSTPSTSEILNNVRELSLDKWKYKGIDQEFLGTYAEEFKDRFGVGDGKTINLVDLIGVLIGSIKELDKQVKELQGEVNGYSIS